MEASSPRWKEITPSAWPWEREALAFVREGLPDHEPYLTAALDDEPEWISGWALAAGADLLLHDSQYTEEEYPHRLGWGHSSVAHAAAFSRTAGVRQLAMFHHDPMRSDRELEELYDQVAAVVRDEQEPPLIAREGLEVALGAG